MRTSILGIHDFGNIDAVIANSKAACQVTHADPRCVASCVAVTTAVALMLQGKHLKESGNGYDVEEVIKEAYSHACDTLETVEQVMLPINLFLGSLLQIWKSQTLFRPKHIIVIPYFTHDP